MTDTKAKKTLGNAGEDAACGYLENTGYNVVCRNYKVRGGEIDIVAHDGDSLVFVEVKTRHAKNDGCAAEAVDQKKIQRMCTAAERYIYEKEQVHGKVRFDVIEVYVMSHNMRINHIKGIDIN